MRVTVVLPKFTILLTTFLLVGFSHIHAAPKLDIGAEYRLRGIQIGNPNYGSDGPLGANQTVDQKYYSQRARVYLTGKFDPGIELGTVIQAIGVAGSSTPITGHYPKEDFSPFIENIYIQINEFHDWPLNFKVGRQPYVWGSGLLISDDGMGFDGISIDAGPFWGLKPHLFTAKATERLVGEHDSDLYLAGLDYQWGIHNIKVGWVMERNNTGAPYSNITTTNSVVSDKISRSYYDLQVSGRLEQGAFYNAEYVMQSGKANIPGQEVKLSGSALTFEGGFDFIHPRYKRMVLAFVFMQGSGDDVFTKDQDERFLPSFGRKYDGLERVGAGDFFAATPYSFFNQSRAIVNRPIGGSAVNSTFSYDSIFSGIRVYGFRGSVTPWDAFTAGLEFYLYTAREKPVQGASGPGLSPITIDDGDIGRELVISARYNYSKKVNFTIRWGKFFPGVLLNDIGSSRLMIEAQGKF